VRQLAATPGVPLGVLEEYAFEPLHIRLAPGDAVILYTDGVTEAADRADGLFGEQRLEEVLAGHSTDSCGSIVDRVFAAVQRFADGAPQADDIAGACGPLQWASERGRLLTHGHIGSMRLFARIIACAYSGAASATRQNGPYSPRLMVTWKYLT
jgi:hypothetical protein